MRIRLRDMEFAHAKYLNDGDKPRYIEWDRTAQDTENEITLFTRQMFHEMKDCKSKIKIAFLNEPYPIMPDAYDFIQREGYKFVDYVLTYAKTILDSVPNAVYTPGSGSTFVENQYQIYPKTKNVSIIASKKNFLIGHQFRHKIIERFKNKIDYVCGTGYDLISHPIVALKDFRYTISVENCNHDYWFTEKIINAFAAGTVPIYWGCPSIKDFFDINGIIKFENIDELDRILDSIGPDDYNKRMNSIKKNFELAHSKYKILEDNMYLNFLKRFDGV
jgi:hypothetical protein